MKPHFSLGRLALLAAVLALLTAQHRPAAAQTSYNFQDLGTLGGSHSYAYGVNDSGQVAGRSDDGAGTVSAFLWLPAPAYGLSAGMNNISPFIPGNSSANDINNSGEVVVNGGNGRAFVWLPAARYGLSSGPSDLNGVLSAMGVTDFLLTQASEISDSHRVTGVARYLPDNTTHGYVLDLNTRTFTELGTVMPGAGINNNADAHVVGGTWLYSLAEGTFTSLSPLASAASINDAAEIVGTTSVSGRSWPAYRSASGQITNLGSFGGSGGGEAFAINNAAATPALVVGYAYTSKGIVNAFRWRVGSAAKDNLNSLVPRMSNFTLYEAIAVSDSGFIVGYGGGTNKTKTSFFHAFLVTPK